MGDRLNRTTLVDLLERSGSLGSGEAEDLRRRVAGDWRSALDVVSAAGGVSEVDLVRAVAEILEVPAEESLDGLSAPDEFFEEVPPEYARRAAVVARRMTEDGVELVAAPGVDLVAVMGEMEALFGRPVTCVLAPRSEIERAVDRSVRQRPEYLSSTASELDDEEFGASESEIEHVTDFGELMRKTPVVKLVSLLVAQAVRAGATDINFQPLGGSLRVRFRCDGILHDIIDVPRSAQDAILSRIKVLGRMDIAERRAAQDGRASFRYADREIDVRMSVVPTNDGERAVLRLFDKQAKVLTLEELGLSGIHRGRFEELIRFSHGMILVTGPTGSGKTTTLNAALTRINSPDVNVITIEDPVEYRLPGISQIQVLPEKNVTFGSMLRYVVRQDPDIIMIGEIRDGETAGIAVQSSLTGHLIFSTLHTNDSPGAVARLLDLGVEPFLLSSALLGVLAQRLVRRVCAHCASADHVSPEELALAGITPEQAAAGNLQRGAGCGECLGTGYHGRVGVFELLVIDDAIRDLINRRAPSGEIREAALAGGLVLLRQDGVGKALAGVTTVSEVLRVTQRDSV